MLIIAEVQHRTVNHQHNHKDQLRWAVKVHNAKVLLNAGIGMGVIKRLVSKVGFRVNYAGKDCHRVVIYDPNSNYPSSKIKVCSNRA